MGFVLDRPCGALVLSMNSRCGFPVKIYCKVCIGSSLRGTLFLSRNCRYDFPARIYYRVCIGSSLRGTIFIDEFSLRSPSEDLL